MKTLCKNGLQGHKQSAQGIALGIRQCAANALEGQKHCCRGDSFAPSGRSLYLLFYPGRCPGLIAVAPLGRF
jgi:hypothetical protein